VVDPDTPLDRAVAEVETLAVQKSSQTTMVVR
jgi:hypothetical protein